MKNSFSGVTLDVLHRPPRTLALIAFLLSFLRGASGQDRLGDLLSGREDELAKPDRRVEVVEKVRIGAEQRRADARTKAAALGLPLRRVFPNGRAIELMDFTGNKPLYFTTHNLNAGISSGADQLLVAPFSVNGAGVNVGEWDGGGARSTHQEFGGRVLIKDGASLLDHSTHVAGTISAAGVVASARGMAPGVTVDSYEWTSDKSEMTARGASYPGEPGKIYLSNHSYGLVNGWNYTGLASPRWEWRGNGTTSTAIDQDFGKYDTNARDTDALEASLPYYLVVRSAGNDRVDDPATGEPVTLTAGGTSVVSYDPTVHPPGDGTYRSGYDTISADALAKNILTIGAVNDAVSGNTRVAANGTMTSFSSWGPTDDGRIKPDLVANGDNLYSTLSTGDAAYGWMSGTSMAAPSATGSAALLVGWWTKLFPGHALRASTLKALLIQTADDLGNPGPDYQYGWGLINVRAAADLEQAYRNNPGSRRIVEDRLTTSITTRTYSFTWDGLSPIRATLAWTDPAGSATTSSDLRTARLVNNLDLKINGPGGSTHLPWVMPFVGTWTTANLSAPAVTGVNTTDNVEQVAIPAPPAAGVYTAVVTFSGTLTNGAQNYSLVFSGCTNVASVAAPGATAVSPGSASTGSTTVTVTGTNFLIGANVTFTRAGSNPVSATGQEVNGDQIRCRVDTTGMAPGPWNVVVTNPDGQSVVLPNGFTIASAIWQDDVESGATGWTSSASVGTINSWATTTAFSNSPTHSFYASAPAAKNIQDLYAPVINIPANAANLRLSFWHRYSLQSTKDGGVLEFSVDGGTTWYDVTAAGSGAAFASGGYNSTLSSQGGSGRNPLAGQSAWSGTLSAFAQVAVDLTDAAKYAGKSLRIRWRLASDSSTASTGWYIDDVALTGIASNANLAPTITTDAVASAVTATGTTTQLSVLASDDGGEPGLTYTWAVVGGRFDRPVSLSDNGTNSAKNTTATFTVAGDYTFTVTVRDSGGLTATSNVRVLVGQGVTTVSVTPGSASILFGGSQQFSASCTDQFGDVIAPPVIAWSSSGGAIDSAGLFNGSAAGGPFTVTATSSGVSGTAQVSVGKAAANVTLVGLASGYDSTPRVVAALTNPPGLTVDVTYDGAATPPTDAGTYAIVATIRDSNYTGSATGPLVVSPAVGAISLSSLSRTYNASAQPVTVTTVPAGIAVNLTYAGSATAPVNAGTYRVDASFADPNYTGTATATLTIATAAAKLNLGQVTAVYDGTQKTAQVTTAPAGLPVTVTYDGSPVPPVTAGSYALTAQIADPNYDGSLADVFTIQKATASVMISGTSQTYSGAAKAVTVKTEPAGLPVEVLYDGASSSPTSAGTYQVHVTVLDPNYTGSAETELTIAKAPAAVALADLDAVYDGTAKTASALTVPAGLPVAVTYDGALTLPRDAGSYAVVASVSDRNYTGVVSGSLVIAKAPAAVSVGGLASTFDGSPKATTVTTSPAGLAVTLSYNGNPVPPVNAGTYAISASITDRNYFGTGGGTLEIAKAAATVALGSLSQAYDGNPRPVTVSTTPSGLSTSVLYNGQSIVPSQFGSYEVAAQITDANYTGSSTATLTITGQTIADWRRAHFGVNEIANGNADDDADPDADGLVNLMEYALGSDPHAFSPAPVTIRDGAGLALQFQRPQALPDVIYVPACSNDGVSWSELPIELRLDGPVQTIRARDDLKAGDPTRRFLRLRVLRAK